MLPPPDFDALLERLERGRRESTPPLLLLGARCGRLAGAPDLEELARQALSLLDPDRAAVATAGPRSSGGSGTKPSGGLAVNLRPGTFDALHRALLSAFSTRGDLEQMVAYGLRQAAPLLASPASLSATIRQLISWAASEGRLGDLLQAAAAYNPGNQALRTFTERQDAPSAGAESVVDEFRARFAELSGLERYSLLQGIYRRIPVPAFYEDLARLVKAGYIRQILTTNIDSLLEQALETIGVVRDVTLDVIVLGTASAREALSALEDTRGVEANRPLVVKLHGDISQGEIAVSPDEIDHAVRTARRYIKDELQAGLVMVGYEGESGTLNDYLARMHGELWWACDEPPGSLGTGVPVRWVQMGPADLFGALATRLLSLRATPPPGATRASGVRMRSGFKGTPPPGPREDELLLLEIDRLNAEVAALAQAPLSTTSPLQRQEHIAHRRQRLRQLEDELRALPAARDRILELLNRVERSVLEARDDDALAVDADTSAYLATQVHTVREQYSSGRPNAHVVSAALGAALVLLERLGPSVVDPEDVRALVAFGPVLLPRPRAGDATGGVPSGGSGLPAGRTVPRGV